MPDIASVAIALAVLAIVGVVALVAEVVRLRRAVRVLTADDNDLCEMVGDLMCRLTRVEARRIYIPSHAAEARVLELVRAGHTEQHARDLAQAEALDDPPTLPAAVPADHSRPSQMAAFGRKA